MAATPVIIKKESEFSYRLIQVAVAQICQSMGFKGAQQPALEALTDVTTRHLQSIAGLAAASANSDGRTESNLPDVIVALEDLASVRGFQGLSNVRSPPLYGSAVVKDLIKFVKYGDEIPFAQPLPRWRSNQCSKRGSVKVLRCCDYDGGGKRREHVPRWLPAMPEMGDGKAVESGEKEVIWGCFGDEKGKKKLGELYSSSLFSKRKEEKVVENEMDLEGFSDEKGKRKVVDSSNGMTKLLPLSLVSTSSCKRVKVRFKIGGEVVD